MKRRTSLVALALLACSSPAAGPRLVVHLVLPDSPSPTDDGLTSLAITVGWDGGEASVTEPFEDGGLELPLPAASVDMTVLGLDDAGTPLWRGIAHGIALPASASGGPAVATMLFGRIGSFSSFASVAAMPPLAGSAAVSWVDGQVLISGGQLADGGLSADIWVYDPTTVQVSLLGQSIFRRAHHLALPVVGPSGQPAVLLAGGDGVGGPTAAVELFWSGGGAQLAPLSAPQREPSGATGEDGRVLIGCGAPASQLLDAYLPSGSLTGNTPGLSGTPLMPGSTTCLLGQISSLALPGEYVVGDGSDSTLDLVDLNAAPLATFWAATPAVRTRFGAVVVGAAVLQFGGLEAGAPVANYEIASNAGPVGMGPLLNIARADFGWLQLPDGGGVLVVGGSGTDGSPLSSAELFDPRHPSPVSSVIPMANARIHPAVADISGYGAALVVSGELDGGEPVAGLEIYTY